MRRKRIAARLAAVSLGLTVLLGSFGGRPVAAETTAGTRDYTIGNPYESVDWENWGQYKADFHSHTVESDGGNQPAEMIEDHYAKGFDILAITDHNATNRSWTEGPELTRKGYEGAEYLTEGRYLEILQGADRNGRGMTPVLYGNEQSLGHHINTFWFNWNNDDTEVTGAYPKLEETMAIAEEAYKANGGKTISHINHPGRYTGARDVANDGGNTPEALEASAKVSRDYGPKYAEYFMTYENVVGLEIVNKKDGDSISDRILWDAILTETIPQGRNVWGFSNDDTHSLGATGFSYNWMLMPANTENNIRTSMKSGAFYASAKVAKRELGFDFQSEGEVPLISNIVVDQDENAITIEGEHVTKVEWISEGEVIAEGPAIDLNDYEDQVGCYVRANLIGPGGISFTQAFPVSYNFAGEAVMEADREMMMLEEDETLNVTLKNLGGSDVNAYDWVVRYDAEQLELVGAEAIDGDSLFFVDSSKSTPGEARIIAAGQPVSGDRDLVKLSFRAKTAGVAGLELVKAEAARTLDGVAEKGSADIVDGKVSVNILTFDVNGDGTVDLKDLSIVSTTYRATAEDQPEAMIYDFNQDGQIDALDLALLTEAMD